MIFGPGRPLPTALLGARLGKLDIVFGRPKQPFPLTYIDNLIDAIELAARPPYEDSLQYIVIDDEQLTLGEYHALRTKITGTKTAFWSAWPMVLAATVTRPVMRLVAADTGAFSRRQTVRASQDRHYSTGRIREELGWTPKVGLADAIERTVLGSSSDSSRNET